MKEVSFHVPGAPYGKGRHRMTRTGHAYTPKETVNYENLVKLAFVEAAPGWAPWVGPVFLRLTARFPIPKSATIKKAVQMKIGDLRPCRKPDMSNILKIIEDALNQVAYADDSQIVDVVAVKTYSETPGVDVDMAFLEHPA